MILHCRPFFRLALLFVALFLCSSMAPAHAASPGRVAFLPFEAHAAKDMGYLTSGIRDMLASRLASGAGIAIVERPTVDKALAGAGKVTQPQQYRDLGRQVGADYLVAGSLTAFGNSLSLDAKVYTIAGNGPAQSFFATAATENDIIKAIDQLAWKIGEKVFGARSPQAGQPSALPAAAPQPAQPSYQTAHPERAFLGRANSGMYGSPFVRPMGVAGALGFTKSQNLHIGLRAMDVGDVDGDGKNEFVLAGPNKVSIYRRTANRFSLVGEARTLARYVIHYVTLADLNRNGRMEIYISAADARDPSSMALEWDGKQFAPLFKDAPWYIRAVRLPKEGMVLAGQKSGINTFLTRGVYRLSLSGSGKLSKGEKIRLPKGINLFDFTFADVDNDGAPEIVAVSQADKLMVLRRSGKALWVSGEYYGGTTRYLGGTDYEDMAAYDEHQSADTRIYVPARIVTRDINNDGQIDIIVNKNISNASRVLSRLRNYPAGEMHALTWNGIGMTELWRTRKIDGYIADFQVGPEIDLPAKEGKESSGKGAELYVGLVLRSSGLNILNTSDSTVLMYLMKYMEPPAQQQP